MTPIYQATIPVIEEYIWRAQGLISFRDLLGFIMQIGKGVADSLYFFHHHFEAVRRMRGGIIGVDADDGNVSGLVPAGKVGERLANVLDVGTMIAHENDQETFVGFEVGERYQISFGVG